MTMLEQFIEAQKDDLVSLQAMQNSVIHDLLEKGEAGKDETLALLNITRATLAATQTLLSLQKV